MTGTASVRYFCRARLKTLVDIPTTVIAAESSQMPSWARRGPSPLYAAKSGRHPASAMLRRLTRGAVRVVFLPLVLGPRLLWARPHACRAGNSGGVSHSARRQESSEPADGAASPPPLPAS